MSVWRQIIYAKSPSDINEIDWNILREIALKIHSFDNIEGESPEKRGTRLCKILGFKSWSDIKKRREKAINSLEFILGVKLAHKKAGGTFSKFADNIGYKKNDGVVCTGQTLKNQYYAAKKMFHRSINDLFEFEHNMTMEKYIQLEESNIKIQNAMGHKKAMNKQKKRGTPQNSDKCDSYT